MTNQPQSVRSALLAARIAHQQRAESAHQYRQALEQATKTGATYKEIGDTLGITRQAVRQYITTN